MPFTKDIQVRWDDVDPNRHLRHTSYGTYAAQARLEFFRDAGIEFGEGANAQIAPILWREELEYRREVGMYDTVTVTAAVSGLREDGSRWAIEHQVLRADGELAARVVVTGAWIHLVERKLAVPSAETAALMHELPRTPDFAQL